MNDDGDEMREGHRLIRMASAVRPPRAQFNRLDLNYAAQKLGSLDLLPCSVR
jgi:hypothetical protein